MASTYGSTAATSTSWSTSRPRPRPPRRRPPAPEEVDDGNLARITLRIPESVKAKAEERAAEAGQSLNTWLVNVVRAASRDGAINIDVDLSEHPVLRRRRPLRRRKGRGNKRMTGWL